MKRIKTFLPKGISIVTAFLLVLLPLLPGSGKAAAIEEWNKDSVYVAGNRISQNGIIYEAAWWTQGEDPSKQTDEWGVWRIADNTQSGQTWHKNRSNGKAS